MKNVIVVTSGKGGVGKSTFAAAAALALVRQGKRVCLIDMDMGLRSLDILLGLQDKVVFDLADVAEGMCRVKQALVRHEKVEGLFLMSAAQTRGSDALTPRQVESVVGQLRDRFDYILIDCPAGVGRGFKNAVCAADRALLIATPDAVALRDAERVCGLLERMDVKKPGLVLNRVKPRDMEDPLVGPDVFCHRLGVQAVGLVPEDERLMRGGMIDLNSDAGRALVRVARRLNEEVVPLEPVRRAPLFKRIIRAIQG